MGLAWREPNVRGPKDYLGRPVVLTLVATFLVHLWLAYGLPMTNDEAYYWDWGQEPHLSYYDHPPGVSYLTWVSSQFFSGSLAARACSPLLYLIALIFSLGSLRLIHASCPDRLVTPLDARRSSLTLLMLATLVPGLSFWGSIALPDSGLMLGISATCYAALRFLSPQRLTVGEGVLFGLALGVAGIFKYHALPIAGGMALGLLLKRRQAGQESSWGFWVAAALVGFYVCLPVWLWNFEHDFASIRFQAQHGFASPSFHVTWGLRVIAAQILLLGGVYWWRAIVFLKEQARPRLADQGAYSIGVWAALPLLLLLTVTSFWKPFLPHWFLPLFWVLLPFVVAFNPGKWPKWQWALSVPLMALTLIFSSHSVRMATLERMHGDPGPLSELTLWQPMAEELDRLMAEDVSAAIDLQPLPGCDRRPILAGMRWYAVAQLRFHLPGHPKVISLDPNHTSYYNARDPEGYGRGCNVWVVTAEKTLDAAKLAEKVDVKEQRPLIVPGHEATPWLIVKGVLR